MSSQIERGQRIRQFILEHVKENPKTIASIAAQEFNISRQAIYKHLKRLTDAGLLIGSGSTRKREYRLPTDKWSTAYSLSSNLEEDIVFEENILPRLLDLPSNVIDILNYGFTEMLNNAVDHSEGEVVFVSLEKDRANTQIDIHDNGIGIFKKIKKSFNLRDETHAILELSKGKLTTDPEKHSGEGVFFTSRMFDRFSIMSEDLCFNHDQESSMDWMHITHEETEGKGYTSVYM